MHTYAKNIEPEPPLRYLITGGLGYAGAWITRHLASLGHTVYVLGRSGQKPDLGSPYTLIQADVEKTDAATLAQLLPEKLDGIIHAASFNESSARGYARTALAVNAFGTRNLLEAVARKEAEPERAFPLFLYCSTFHVYGATQGRITENTPPAPRSDYALTHFFAEEYCRMFARTEGLPCIITRLTNGYGAPKTLPCTKWYLLLNDLCRCARIEGRISLHSNPTTPRDFVWLGDVANATTRLLQRRDLAGRIFNLAYGKSTAIGEVAGLVAQLASHHYKKNVPLLVAEQKISSRTSTNTGIPSAPALCVANNALKAATGISFHNRMEKEITSILTLLDQEAPLV